MRRLSSRIFAAHHTHTDFFVGWLIWFMTWWFTARQPAANGSLQGDYVFTGRDLVQVAGLSLVASVLTIQPEQGTFRIRAADPVHSAFESQQRGIRKQSWNGRLTGVPLHPCLRSRYLKKHCSPLMPSASIQQDVLGEHSGQYAACLYNVYLEKWLLQVKKKIPGRHAH